MRRCRGSRFLQCFQWYCGWRLQRAWCAVPPILPHSKYFYATALRCHFRPCVGRLIFQSSHHGERRRPFPHPSRPGPRPGWRAHDARRPAAPEDLPGRGASGYPPRRRRPQSAGFGREGKRPVQRARPGHYGRRRAEGAERLESGRQRRADPRPARDGEGADREAQPAARRGARTVVRQREGGGRPPALSGARWRQPRRREGARLFSRARRRGWPRLPRPGPRRPPPVPLHRLRRGRRRAGRLARDHPRPDEDDGG